MPNRIEEVKEYNPNTDDDGAVVKGQGLLPMPTGLGYKAVTAEQYARYFENTLDIPESGTIAKAVEAFRKSIQAPPNAFSFGVANIMPDPSNSEGIRPWPGISPDSLGKIVQENIAPQLIIGMRVDDVLRYSISSTHPWRPGWRFELSQGQKSPSDQDKKDMLEASTFLQNSNVETGNKGVRERDKQHLTNFQRFLSSLTRDSLTYDGIAIWTDMTNGKGVKGYTLLPASYVRLIDPRIGYKGDKSIFAVMLDQGGQVASDPKSNTPITFTREQLVWYTRNPRVDPYVGGPNGYGYPEIEMGVRIIQGFQNAIDLNVDTFNRSGIPNGMLVLEGGGWVQKQLDVLMRMWNNLKRGITKAWALPVIATPPNGKVSVLNLNDLKGSDVRYQDHMNMMVGALCTIYRFPVHRLGYRISGKGPDTQPAPDSSARIIDEDDPGLTPLLTHIENVINEYLIWPHWPHLRFAFTGKSPKEDAREYEFRKNAMTMGEARAETDLVEMEKLPGADGDELEFVAKLMSLAPLDPNLAGIFQTVASAIVKAKYEGSDKDGDQPGQRMQSARDPARTEGHGYTSGVRRSAAKGKQTLYVSRRLQNTDDFLAWAKAQGFTKTLLPDDLHVTIAFSRKAIDMEKFELEDEPLTTGHGVVGRTVVPLGDKGAVVLKFRSRVLHDRWEEFIEGGCTWDFESYHPHITITYDGGDMDLSKIKPYTGELIFGPEVFAEVVEDWEKKIVETAT